MNDFISSVAKLIGESATTLVSQYPRYAVSKVNAFLEDATNEGEKVRVYAVGGDGILFDCLNGMVKYPGHELTSVPYGNANDFLRAFGEDNVPLFRDIKALSEADSIPTDVFRCGSNVALSIASLGLEGSAILVTEKMAKFLSKISFLRKLIPMLYVLGAIVVIFNKKLRSQYYHVTLDGVDYSGEYVDINVGNTLGNGGKNVSNPYAVPNDGWLNAVFIRKMPLIKCLLTTGSFTKGEFEKFPDYFFQVRFKKFHAISDEPIRICADGEAFYTSDLNVEIYPAAMKIIAPKGVTYRTHLEYKDGK
jgi:diacylglycerol kinase family enzyme